MENPKNYLSKDALKLLGTNHPLWSNGLFGDMSERKVALLNKLAAEGYSHGWLQSIARFPTQLQEVICRLALEKGLDKRTITKETGMNFTHVATTFGQAASLGFLPSDKNDVMSSQRLIAREAAAARRLARKEARDNPQKLLSSAHVEKDGRFGVRPAQAEALLKATRLLNGGHSTAAAPAPAIDVVATVAKATVSQALPIIVETAGIESDPSKRVVEVSLRMTVEELGDFVKAVNAKKEAGATAEAE